MKKNHRIFYPYVSVFILWVFLVISTIAYLNNQSKKELLIELHSLDEIIKNIIILDFKAILNLEKEEKFFLFNNLNIQNEGIKNTELVVTSIEIDEENIHIDKSKIHAKFDLQTIREKLNEILPKYVNYKINIDNITLGTRTENSDVKGLDLKSNYSLSPKNTLSIELAINNKSNYFSNKISSIHNNRIKIIMLFAICITLTLYKYLLYVKKLKLEKNKLTNLIDNLVLENQLLLNREVVNNKLNGMIIERINELNLIKNLNIDGRKSDEHSSSYKELLPVCLIDIKEDYIEIYELFKDLNSYFAPGLENIILEFKSEIDKVKLSCSKTVFYQIIFSLIYNIILFVREQENRIKKIILEVTSQSIIILYESLPLTKERMIILSDQIFGEFNSFFILNCRHVFDSIENNKLKYIIDIKDRLNKFELSIINCEELVKTSKIIDFYRDRKV